MKKPIFTKDDYFKLLQSKLTSSPQMNSPVDKLKRAVQIWSLK